MEKEFLCGINGACLHLLEFLLFIFWQTALERISCNRMSELDLIWAASVQSIVADGWEGEKCTNVFDCESNLV